MRGDDLIWARCLEGRVDWRALAAEVGCTPDEAMGRAVESGAWFVRGVGPEAARAAWRAHAAGEPLEVVARRLGTDEHGALVWLGKLRDGALTDSERSVLEMVARSEGARVGEVTWLRHDAGSHDVWARLIMERGHEGYGLMWHVYELLCTAPGHELDCSRGYDALAWQLGMDGEGECRALMADLADMGLLECEGDRYSSPVVDAAAERAASVAERNRRNGARGGRPPKP